MANNSITVTLSFKCKGLHSRPQSFKHEIIIPLHQDLHQMPPDIPKHYIFPYPKEETAFPDNTRLIFNSKYGVTTHIFDLNALERHHPQLVQLLWIPQKKEWVAIPSKRYDYCHSGCQEFFKGPYQIDDYCAGFLNWVYHLHPESLTTQETRHTCPTLLEKIAASKAV